MKTTLNHLTRSALIVTSFALLSACASNQTPEPVEHTPEPVEQTPEPVVSAPVETAPVVEPEVEVFTPPPAPSAKIEFAFDSSSLEDSEKSDLQVWAAYINDLMINRVEIHGYADAIGTDDYNRQLSAQRAYSTAEALRPLLDHHVDVNEVAHGEAEPLADNANEEGRQLNRRVEVIIPEDNQVGLESMATGTEG